MASKRPARAAGPETATEPAATNGGEVIGEDGSHDTPTTRSGQELMAIRQRIVASGLPRPPDTALADVLAAAVTESVLPTRNAVRYWLSARTTSGRA